MLRRWVGMSVLVQAPAASRTYTQESAGRRWSPGHIVSSTYLCTFIKYKWFIVRKLHLGRAGVGFWKSLTVPPISPARAWLPCATTCKDCPSHRVPCGPRSRGPAPCASGVPWRVQAVGLPCTAMHKHSQGTPRRGWRARATQTGATRTAALLAHLLGPLG